ncbi:MAG: MarR family transcriptional regulator [Alphaproteobacteria bacterium]|nr:MarR family transcriptional regulator [Alphaproteobacteria bacterium]
MLNRTANLLGAVGLAVADRIEKVALDVMNRAGETPAALIVIGSGTGPSNDQLKRILGLSHPGTVRLVDRLEADGLVERRRGKDKRSIALFLTEKGHTARNELLVGRLATIAPLLSPLDEHEQDVLASLLHKLLAAIPDSDLDRCHLCRMCDNNVCTDCPIPADFRQGMTL